MTHACNRGLLRAQRLHDIDAGGAGGRQHRFQDAHDGCRAVVDARAARALADVDRPRGTDHRFSSFRGLFEWAFGRRNPMKN